MGGGIKKVALKKKPMVVAPRVFKNTPEERVFEKMVSNFTVLEGILRLKFRVNFFGKK